MTVAKPAEAQPELPYGDGSGKIFGMENFGNTCYCNSILQCLYYTDLFRTKLVLHNNEAHNRRTKVPGIKPHGFTTKYEQLVAKKLKEQGKLGVGSSVISSNSGSATGANGDSSTRETNANGSAGSHLSSGVSGSSQSTPPTSSGTKRGSIFGIKFGSSNNGSNNNSNNGSGIGNGATAGSNVDGWENMKKNSILDATHCAELSPEQRMLISKSPDFQKVQLLITRPPTQPQNEKMDYSQSSSMLLPKEDSPGNGANGSGSCNGSFGGGATSGTKSIVVVGIPYQEPLGSYNPNPSSDQRKRAALINGPILNLDCSLLPQAKQYEHTALLYALRDMFESMIENQSQIGVVSPTWFINKLKEKNYLFRQNNMHHDAHEFCNYLINDIIECIDFEQKNLGDAAPNTNWCNDIFKGLITNETKCLSCESISSREESFLDLSVDIPPGESSFSLTHSLNNFSKLESLTHQNKFYCNTCCSLQEATKTIKIKKLPEVLVINFKRFKYDENVGRMVKLFDSISYSHKLRLFNTKSEQPKKDESTTQHHHHHYTHHRYHGGSNGDDFTLYELYGLVIHIGGGPMHGHYISLCKIKAKLWLLFDDETVELVDDLYVMRFFGDGPGLASAYILFYRKTTTEEVLGLEEEESETEEAEEQILDFGFKVDEMYHGGDYSLGLQSLDNSNNRVDLTLHSIISEEIGSGLSTVSTSEPEPLAKKASGLFKKNFKLDNNITEEEAPKPVTQARGFIAEVPAPPEKKSWVEGLKRRESSVVVPERKNSAVSESSVDSGRRKGFFGFKRKSKE